MLNIGWVELVLIGLPALVLLGGALLVAKQYKRCPSNKVLVIYGQVGGEKTARCIHGGGAFIVPMIQGYAFLPLEPMTLNVDLRGALSKTNIRVNVPSNFTIAISTKDGVLDNAAERLLGLSHAQLVAQAQEIIFGQLRLVVASLTIEEINQDREKFLNLIAQNVDAELNKIGLEVINVNITDVTDESGYIQAIGQKSAAQAIQQAQVDVAEQERQGAIGVEGARRQQVVAVSQQRAEAAVGQKDADRMQRIQVAAANANAVGGENDSRAQIAESEARYQVRRAEAARQGKMAEANAERDVLRVQKEAEVARLEAGELARQEVEKRKAEIEAEADAQKIRLVAAGEADRVRLTYLAEAEGTQKVLEAKAEGYRHLISAAGGQAGDAATLLMLEKVQDIVREQVKAVASLKIDSIVVWDGGGGANQPGTAKFLRDFVGMASPLHGVAQQTGLRLPDFLGTMATTAAKPAASGPESGNGRVPQTPES